MRDRKIMFVREIIAVPEITKFNGTFTPHKSLNVKVEILEERLCMFN